MSVAGMEINRLDLDTLSLRCLQDTKGGVGQRCPSASGHVHIFTRMENLQEGQMFGGRFGAQVFEMSTRHFNSSIEYTVQYFHLKLRKEHWATDMNLRLFNIYKEFKS